MAIVKAKDLKVGMELDTGAMVVTVIIINADLVELELQVYDPDCGEVDFLSFQENAEETYNIN